MNNHGGFALITDVEGLAWLRALEAELGKKTEKLIFDPVLKKYISFPFNYQTKDVPLPLVTEHSIQHLIALVEKRVRSPC